VLDTVSAYRHFSARVLAQELPLVQCPLSKPHRADGSPHHDDHSSRQVRGTDRFDLAQQPLITSRAGSELLHPSPSSSHTSASVPGWSDLMLTHLLSAENVSTPPTPPLLFSPTFLPPPQSSIRSIHFSPVISSTQHQNICQRLLCIFRHVSIQSVSEVFYSRYLGLTYFTYSSFFDVSWQGPVLDANNEPTQEIQGTRVQYSSCLLHTPSTSCVLSSSG
jgi:hypothetical protein